MAGSTEQVSCGRKIGPYDCCSVVQGDCLELMAALPDGCVDAVITDPPYGYNYATNHWVNGCAASWANTTIANDGDTKARDAWVQWACTRGVAYAVFGSWKKQRPEYVRGVLIWDKGPASGMGDLSFPWKPSWEEIYIGGKQWAGDRDEGVIKGHTVVTWESMGRSHPNEKPVSLMEHLIEKVSGTVLDPFAGSGTTLVAAAKLGRHFLGFEISPEYCAIARARIAAVEAQPTLFQSPAEQLLLETVR